jgi:spore germination protein GerM
MKTGPRGRIRFLLIFILAIILIIYFGRDSLFKKIILKKNEAAIYFVKNGALEPVTRTLPTKMTDKEKLNFAISELLKGPEIKEKKAGLTTMIPKNVRLLKSRLSNNIAELDFSNQLANYGGGTATVQSLVGQIVYTATEDKEIKKVKFFIEGKDEEIVLGGEGFVIDRPLGRNDLNL